MIGYDFSWAAFNIIEVMSSTKFTYKVNKLLKNLICAYDLLIFIDLNFRESAIWLPRKVSTRTPTYLC
jgi:hypothetical protein